MEVTPREAARTLRQMAKRIERELLGAERTALRYGLRIAKGWSSGTVSTRELRRLGHPFRHGGSGLGDPGLINRQTGVFLRSWKTEGPERMGGAIFGRIYNDAPQAAFLQSGTRKMVPRPIRDRVLRFLQPATYRLIREAIYWALRG